MDLKKIKAVVFDADNTLYSTKKIAKDADMAAMELLAQMTVGSADALYKEFIGIVDTVRNSPDPKLRHRKYSYGKLCWQRGVDLIEEMYKVFGYTVLQKLEVMPQTDKLLEQLHGKFELYVVTEDNREMAIRKLTKLNLLSKFKGVVTSDDAGAMKPSKNYYLEILSKFKPEETLVLGDNYAKDLEIPEQLGMQTFLVEKPEDLNQFASLIKES